MGGSETIFQGEFASGFQQIGYGMFLTSAGLVAIADSPLSLAGDILTLPVAYARANEYSWATWWGERSFVVAPPDGAGNNTTEGEIEPPD